MIQKIVQLTDRKIIQPRFQGLGLSISEYTFANIFLFRHVHGYELVEVDSKLFIRGMSYDKKTYLMPTYDISGEDPVFLKKLLTQADMLFPIPEVWAQVLSKNGFHTDYKEEDSDYIYCLEAVRTFAGRHLASRRNLVAQFKSLYVVEQAPLNRDTQDAALTHLMRWQEAHGDEKNAEVAACREAIMNIEALALTGMVFTVEKRVVGFIIGEPLAAGGDANGKTNMFVFHFAKGDIQYKGVYQYMYQEYAKNIENYEFLNWEQDMGDPGIRQAKNSYEPHHKEKKMRVTL